MSFAITKTSVRWALLALRPGEPMMDRTTASAAATAQDREVFPIVRRLLCCHGATIQRLPDARETPPAGRPARPCDLRRCSATAKSPRQPFPPRPVRGSERPVRGYPVHESFVPSAQCPPDLLVRPADDHRV